MFLRQRKFTVVVTVILGFRRDVDEICGLLGYYTASCGWDRYVVPKRR